MNSERKKVLLIAPLEDQQSGEYIFKSLVDAECKVAPIDSRNILKSFGLDKTNEIILKEAERLQPDFILILKGTELKKETIRDLKKYGVVAIWIFDVTLAGVPITESTEYIELIKEANYFFTIAKGQIETLKSMGVNAHFLREGCHPAYHKEEILNWYQSQKYNSDVMFSGSIGTTGFHESRIKFLEDIKNLNINLKIYGAIHDPKKISNLLSSHFGRPVINSEHNIAVQCSKIVLGKCGWPDIEESYSARLYRVLAAGGFYLTNYIKGMENTFKINKQNELPAGDEEFIVYYDDIDCLSKIIYFLDEKNDDIRQKIAKNGQKRVLNDFTFLHSVKELLSIIGEKNE